MWSKWEVNSILDLLDLKWLVAVVDGKSERQVGERVEEPQLGIPGHVA